MAKNFGNAGSSKAFENTKKTEQEKAQVIVVQNIHNENLIDNPKNGEDISMVDDLVVSMEQNGFTDPMEVTDFGMENGKYMILSGHRRRAAGVQVFGKDFAFPCVVRHFKNEQEVQNYTLMANSQRDSAKDPCLFCTRYKLHEQYLKDSGFKGNIREEVAKRLGISVQQADRYNAINRVILPVWDMIRAEIVGMSSVQPMAKHSEAEQIEIYNIMQEALKKDVALTRDTVKKIVDNYRNGKKTWAEIADLPRDSGLPLSGPANIEPGETKEPGERNRNDEVRHDFDPIAAEYDKMDEDKAKWEEEQKKEAEDEIEDSNTFEEIEESVETETSNEENKEKHQLTREEKELKMGVEFAKQLEKLDTTLSSAFYRCEDENAALSLLNNMKSVTLALIDEMYRLSADYDKIDDFHSALEAVVDSIKQYND